MNKQMIQLKKRMPLEHAKNAYENGFYIEGMQILHANLEISLRILLLIIRKENNADTHEIEDMLAEFNYIRCSKLVFILGFIEKDTYDKLCEFNKWKNFIINRLLLHVYKDTVPQISIQQYTRSFQLGVLLNEKILSLLDKTNSHIENR